MFKIKESIPQESDISSQSVDLLVNEEASTSGYIAETQNEMSDTVEDIPDSSRDSNKAIEEFDEMFEGVVTPLKKKKLRSKKYIRRKLLQSQTASGSLIQRASGFNLQELQAPSSEVSIPISWLQEKIVQLTRDKVCQLLTLLPEDWSLRQIIETFGVTKHLAEKSKSLRKEQGILPTITSKKGTRSLDEGTEELVQNYFEDDEISRQCAGIKECITMKIGSQKVKKQKRLLLCNLREAHRNFLEKNPENNVSFSKFCTLRPRWVVFPNDKGMHNVCVCLQHVNVKLMIVSVPDKGVAYK